MSSFTKATIRAVAKNYKIRLENNLQFLIKKGTKPNMDVEKQRAFNEVIFHEFKNLKDLNGERTNRTSLLIAMNEYLKLEKEKKIENKEQQEHEPVSIETGSQQYASSRKESWGIGRGLPPENNEEEEKFQIESHSDSLLDPNMKHISKKEVHAKLAKEYYQKMR